MKMRPLLLTALICFSMAMVAQVNTYSNIDDSLTNWGECYHPSCDPGGTGTPTQVLQQVVGSPSIDGNSMEFSVSGNSGVYTDALWYYKPGPFTAATYFKHSFQTYLGSNSSIAQAFEFDLFQFDSTNSVEYMFGEQCSQSSGYWQVWNYQASPKWVNTKCSL